MSKLKTLIVLCLPAAFVLGLLYGVIEARKDERRTMPDCQKQSSAQVSAH